MEPGMWDGRALHVEADRQRQAQGLSWAEVGRAIGVSPGTIKRMASAPDAEADGVLALCRWLGRPLEQFAHPPCRTPSGKGPTRRPDDVARSGRFLRVDVPGLHARLDTERQRRGLTWAALARELDAGVPMTAAILRRLERGGRITANQLLAFSTWLDRPVDDLLHLSEN